MNKFSVVIIKTLLISVCALEIILSTFLIALIFDMWIQDGMPPFENIKFSISLFFVILLIFVIGGCLKFLLDISIDNRASKNVKDSKTKRAVDDVPI